jgi:UDP-2,3-diacylglucosamine pyrophosphatase LpxH
MDTWNKGFVTQNAAFEWAASSRFFSARRLEEVQNRSKRKERAKRKMYTHFLAWAQEQKHDEPEPVWTKESVTTEALAYFNKKAEYDKLIEEHARIASIHEAGRRVNSVFNGTLVGEWTGLKNMEVKRVMDKVRQKLGGEAAMDGMTIEEIRKAVEQANVELGNVTVDI